MNRYLVLFLGFIALVLCSCNQAQARSFAEGWTQNGPSSYYAKRFNGRKTASGERYQHYAMTAAHRSLPFGTKVQVTDRNTGKSIVVKINDRGPFHGNRILDLSGGAANKLGITKQGVCDIELKVLSMPDPKPKKEFQPISKISDSYQARPRQKVFKNRTDSIADLIAVGFDATKL